MCGGSAPHMQQQAALLGRASSSCPTPSASSPYAADRRGGLFVLPRRLVAPSILWSLRDGSRARRKAGRIAAAAARGGQDHYAVLGVPRHAAAADVKRAYRLLARKYHPDVNQDLRAGDAFKRIRLAYEVLSDERRRAQYDREIDFDEASYRSLHRNWAYDPELNDRRRMYRWAELRQQMWHRHKERTAYGRMYTQKESPDYERGPFSEVLWSVFFTLFLMRTLGARVSLTLSSLGALFDNKLDAGYKMGYMTAWFLGGQGGILLTMCISFASWLCGKNSSGLVALVVLAMWVAGNLARFVPIPQGAILTLLYMSIKLQVNQK